MRRWFISLFVTPKRVRAVIARVISWLLYKCTVKGAWGTVSRMSRWLRYLADFIDAWNATELKEDQDILIADLVRKAVTDEELERLIDKLLDMSESYSCSAVSDYRVNAGQLECSGQCITVGADDVSLKGDLY